ncbi:TPA: hypothetical protein I9080_003114 [Clostridium perfringens]|uniref:Uncharacterized protein n=1 Tax=Clostridium perfringens TaxID=1502 RepID=A0A8H9R1V0_CLOPF|nr:hypothetical protein [Clostridium perfringens]
MGTYKTNWQLTETVMPEDMNRIEENTKENNNALSEFKKQYNADSKEENKKIERKAEKEDVVLKVPFPEDRDCNSFKTLNAFCTFDTGSGDFKNTPHGNISGGGRVFILKNTGHIEGRIQQEFINLYPSERISRYIRNLTKNTWGKWYKVYDEANKPTAKELGVAAVSMPMADTDLNNHKEPGFYWGSQNMINAPIPNGVAIMEVVKYNEDYLLQRFTSLGGNNSNHTTYIRTCYVKSWSDWVKVYDENNRPTPIDIGAIAKIPPRLTQDLNTATTSGLYVVERAPHAPQSYGRLLVLGWDNDQKWITQVFFSDIQNKVYVRCSTNTTATEWTSWAEQYSTKFKPTPQDIGALPTTGGELSGHLIMRPGQRFLGAYNYGYSCQTKEGTYDYVIYIDADNKVHVGYDGRPVKIDSIDIVNKNNKKIYHEDNKPTAADVGASPTNHNHDSVYLGKTATAANSNKLANMGLYDSSKGIQGIPNVGNDGVMEVGRMIDFHEAGTNKDFNTRLESINGALKCWQDFSAISLWAQKYLRINDWYGGSEDGRFYYKQEGKQLRTENIETLYVNGSAVAKGDYWDVGESTRVFNLGGGLRLVRQWIGTNASNSAGGVSYTIHFPKAWSWVIPISLVSDNMANTNSYTSGYCTIDALSNVHLNGGCYQMTPGKSTRIHLTYLAGE